MEKNIYKLNSSKLLAGILILAAVLRFQGIFWGIPLFDPLVQGYHPDEPKIIKGATNFPYHILSNNDLRYPTFYHYSLGVLSAPFKLIFKTAGWSPENYQVFISVFSRIISVLLALGSILLTFILGKKLYNEKVALLSALFLSLSFYHVQNSAWATLDVPNSFFFILTVFFAYKMYENPSLKYYLLTGASLGVLIGTKYNGAVAVVLILILHFYQRLRVEKTFRGILQASVSKNLWLLFLSAGLVFLATTPGILVKPAAFSSSVSELLNRDTGRQFRAVFDYSVLVRILKNAISATDPFLTASMILGLIFPLRKRWDREIPLVITLLVFIIAFGSVTSRHLISILPLASILGAQAVYYLYIKVSFISKPLKIAILILWIVFALVYNLIGIYLRTNDTRTDAAHYIQKNLSTGSRIGAASIGNYQRWDWMFPKIDDKNFKVVDALEKPEYVILTSYDFVKIQEALLSEKLKGYAWDPEFSLEWYKARPPSEEVFRFYDNILNKQGEKYGYRLIKKFEKKILVPIEFPPPQIRIYKRIED